MNERTTPKGVDMPVIGQPTRMECWITCYQMMLTASGINWSLEQIEKRMTKRGFGDARKCRMLVVERFRIAEMRRRARHRAEFQVVNQYD